MENFIKIDPAQLTENVFELFHKDWMLITSGAPEQKNTMTASWGGMGIMWAKNVAYCVIRPQRFTYRTMEAGEYYTFSFFEERRCRDQLNHMGKVSGFDEDKIAGSGLTPVDVGFGCTAFTEAKCVMTLRKLYYTDVNPQNFIDASLDKIYPTGDYHRMYFGEIVECFVRQ